MREKVRKRITYREIRKREKATETQRDREGCRKKDRQTTDREGKAS